MLFPFHQRFRHLKQLRVPSVLQWVFVLFLLIACFAGVARLFADGAVYY